MFFHDLKRKREDKITDLFTCKVSGLINYKGFKIRVSVSILLLYELFYTECLFIMLLQKNEHLESLSGRSSSTHNQVQITWHRTHFKCVV